jgi:NAD(P)-dependent dehydrogenase (short-subunit alcohol dehydrogenase family)
MTNPIAIVTGGSRGIGAATVRMLARRGYDVAFTFLRDDKAAAHVFSDVEMFDRRAMALKAGCSDEAAILDLFAQVDEEFGAPALLVCNAANTGPSSRVDEVSYETLRMVADLNIVGPILLAKEAIKRMSTKHGGVGGAIVNVSSITSYLGSPASLTAWRSKSPRKASASTQSRRALPIRRSTKNGAVTIGWKNCPPPSPWGASRARTKLPRRYAGWLRTKRVS